MVKPNKYFKSYKVIGVVSHEKFKLKCDAVISLVIGNKTNDFYVKIQQIVLVFVTKKNVKLFIEKRLSFQTSI